MKKTVHIRTFGCQMNLHDSEIVRGLLKDAGYGFTDDEDSADVILFNTCCVRDHAEQRVYSRISQLRNLKSIKPNLLLGVGGCVAQKEKTALAEKFPHLDIVYGPNAINEIASLLKRAQQGERPVISVPENGPDPKSHVDKEQDSARHHAWVSIMRGCDNYCSYCVVPYVRGPQRSKSPEDVIDEVKGLVEEGIIEITLLGQNVNSYGQDLKKATAFADLLGTLDKVSGIKRIRFTTSHPKDISTDLMQALHDLPKVCEHLHLPAQSGSSRILELMNRGYTSDEYIDKIEKLRAFVPEICITTDIIVGFPGETEEDFDLTRQLMESVQFDGAYIFKYSRRTGTAAARIDGELDTNIIKDRHRGLLDLQKEISRNRLKRWVGTTQSVLPDKEDKKRPGHLLGRTRGHRVVSFEGLANEIGSEVDVFISGSDGWTLLGEKLSSVG